jgi:hypothetical protein
MIITNIDVLELGKIILPAFAILISVISLVISNRNTRRQVRIGKLEEIIECLQVFLINYKYLYDLHRNQLSFKNVSDNISKDEDLKLIENYREYVEAFKTEVEMDKFQDKTIRLRVLANSYLPDKKLKLKILSLVTLVANLVNCTIFEDFERAKTIFQKYPNPLIFLKYIDKIEQEIILEMKLGYKGSKISKLEAYKTEFIRDLKI